MVKKAASETPNTAPDTKPVAKAPGKKVVQLRATKNKLTNAVTGDKYHTLGGTTPSKGIGHWEQRQIDVGLLVEV